MGRGWRRTRRLRARLRARRAADRSPRVDDPRQARRGHLRRRPARSDRGREAGSSSRWLTRVRWPRASSRSSPTLLCENGSGKRRVSGRATSASARRCAGSKTSTRSCSDDAAVLRLARISRPPVPRRGRGFGARADAARARPRVRPAPSARYFRWKHLANPFGPSLLLVAESEERIVGLRAFMRWRFRAGDHLFESVRAVDTATHPDYRRIGVFAQLTSEALERVQGTVDLVFNVPNPTSLRQYTRLGWQLVGSVPRALRVRRPLGFVRGIRSIRSSGEPLNAKPRIEARPVAEALQDGTAISRLLGKAEVAGDRLATPRTLEYLRWRYAAPPFLDYRGILENGEGSEPSGLAIFRLRPRGRLWESSLVELITVPGDGSTARKLLRRVVQASPVHHLTCSFPPPDPLLLVPPGDAASCARRPGSGLPSSRLQQDFGRIRQSSAPGRSRSATSRSSSGE